MNLACERLYSLLVIAASIYSIKGATQSFRETPTNQTIQQGGHATLKCAVDNLHGDVQWVKDGAVLGFERPIPGYEHLSMIGSVALGEHHLAVDDAALEDDALYQCQVTPTQTQPALVAPAYLSVIIPSSRLFIEGHSNGTVIEVPHHQSSLNLTCMSIAGKPAATITWYKNGEQVTEGIHYSSAVTAQGSKLLTATSILTLQPTGEDDEAYFTCRAQTEGLITYDERTVQLSVLYPPEDVVITGYTEGRVLRSNDTLRLMCRSIGGNPLPDVYWFKNGVLLDTAYKIGDGVAENEMVFEVTPDDNQAVYRCESRHKLLEQHIVKEVTLTVHFAPSTVEILGARHGDVGDTIMLSCVTDISNPAAAIEWRSGLETIAAPNTMQSHGGGFITTSNVSVTLTQHRRSVEYFCEATNNAVGVTVQERIQLEVKYPPETPVIKGYTPGREVLAGNAFRLLCECRGGNPPATVSWYKAGRELEGFSRSTGNIVTKEITFLLKPDDNMAEYRCNASNAATPQPLTTTVQLSVNFPPANVTIVTDPPVARAGRPLTLTCRSATSNPSSEVSWWKDGVQIQGVEAGHVVPAAYGGKSTISNYTLTPTYLNNKQIYSCKATNVLVEQGFSNGTTLNVLHVPTFPADTPTTVDILEGEARIINMTAMSNPVIDTYTWYKDGVELQGGVPPTEAPPSRRRRAAVTIAHFYIDGGVLNVTNITRADAGNYTIHASNAEGGGTFSFHMNVQYPASISTITETTMVDKGATATLRCVADANPVKASMVSWRRAGYDLSSSRITATSTDTSATLQVVNVSKADTGQFMCEVANGIGTKASAPAYLVVKFAPEIDTSPALGKAAAEDGGTAILRCQAEGAPKVTFTWKKDTKLLDLGSPRFKATETKINVIRYESELRLYNVSKTDYGSYHCLASNELGEDFRYVTLDGTSKPDAPFGLQLINVTHNSIALRWNPGFDGGANQHFQIRYVVRNKDAYTYEMVDPPSATAYVIKGLQLGTEYDVTVRAINSLGEGEFQTKVLTARTSAVLPVKLSASDIPLLVILTVSIIGLILLACNILLILFFIRRRRRKMGKGSSSSSTTNSIEMYNAPTITEDSKSVSTVGRRSLAGEFPQDFKPYDDDDEMKRFLPSAAPPAYDRFGSLHRGGSGNIYGGGPPYPADPRGSHTNMGGPRNLDDERPRPMGTSRDPIYEDHNSLPPMGKSTGWPTQHTASPYSSLPGGTVPPPRDHLDPVEMTDDDYNYAQKLRINQLKNASARLGGGSNDGLHRAPQNQPLPAYKAKQPFDGPIPEYDTPIRPPPPPPSRLSSGPQDYPQKPRPPAPPPPPVEHQMPPLPQRNYAPEDMGPAPERYTAPPSRAGTDPSEMKGHLV